MGKPQSGHAFGRKNASSLFGEMQAPLVQDGRKLKSAARGPTSHAEAYWPFYVGVGVPGLFFGFITVLLIASGAGRSVIGLVTLLFSLPFIFLGFLLVSIVATRALSSIRGGAETIGNLTLLTRTNAGFKIGALVGFSVFLWYSPDNFVDPFTGEPSFKSAIVALVALKILAFMGFFGMVFSRLENFVRRRVWTNLPEDERGQVEDVLGPALQMSSPPNLPPWLENVHLTWQRQVAVLISILVFFGQVFLIVRSGQMPGPASLIGTAVYCLLSYMILRFYLKVVDKLLRVMSGLYGFSIGVRQGAL